MPSRRLRRARQQPTSRADSSFLASTRQVKFHRITVLAMFNSQNNTSYTNSYLSVYLLPLRVPPITSYASYLPVFLLFLCKPPIYRTNPTSPCTSNLFAHLMRLHIFPTSLHAPTSCITLRTKQE